MAAAVRIEDVKAAGISVDIDRLARDGFASISDEDRYRLKTQGVCTQRQVGAFMLRIRVAGGKATPAQMRCVADLAERFGRPSVHVTTRGGLELHHVRIEDVTEVQTELARVGLTTKGTCGDTIRNVIACAHAGTYAGEVLSLQPFAVAIHERVVAISDATNISRKMNVALACSPHCDDHVATSDIGFVATPDAAGGPPTFTVWGAGGLGAAPRLAIELRRGVAQGDLLAAFDAIVAIGVKYGDRTARAKAKIKMLVEKLGAERVRQIFDEEFVAATAPQLATLAASGDARVTTPRPIAGGPIEQKQSGLFTIPALVPMGELSVAAARELAAACERWGDGIVHLTPDQNAEIQGVAKESVAAVIAAIEGVALRASGRGGISDVLSCVGLEYCPLAVTHSMTMGEEISVAFASLHDDPRYADFRIHVSGCPHSCAKHQVADIGLAGAMTEVDGTRVEAFALYIGGNARSRTLGALHAKKIPRTQIVHVIESLLAEYEEHALANERFSETIARVGTDIFFHAVAAIGGEPRVPLPTARGGRLVVIGNGMAGARFVEELRARASDAFDITILGEESHGGYNRIMLSGVLGGFREPHEIVTHPVGWYDERSVALHRGARATAIDRSRKAVTCADGTVFSYDALVIATGSRPMIPPIPGLDAAHVFVFRTIDDCGRIRDAVRPGARAVVLGGGLLGLEAASGLRSLGAQATVVHMAATLMEQQLDAEGGRALRTRVEAMGIAVRTSARAMRAYDDDSGRGIELADGERVAGDIIVVCCGIVPNVELARDAGLAVKRAIVVSDGMQTDDPSIFAIGECVQHRDVTYGLVEPLWEQATVLADRLTRRRTAYAGSKIGTKLKVAGVNVVALGQRDALPGDESIATVDANGAYRRAIARNGVLVGAQVVGDAAAAAAFGKAFERGAALPGSLAALMFGGEGIATVRPALSLEDERVCVCNEVSRAEIQTAIDGGAHDVAEIGRVTLAGTGCGTCRGELAQMIISAPMPAS